MKVKKAANRVERGDKAEQRKTHLKQLKNRYKKNYIITKLRYMN